MGFGRFINKVSTFGKKLPSEINHIGGKVIGGLDKTLKIGSKVLDVADKATNALKDVPVLGEVAGGANALIKQGENFAGGARNGLDKAKKLNNKIGRIHI